MILEKILSIKQNLSEIEYIIQKPIIIRINILSSLAKHYECLPFLLEILKKLKFRYITVFFSNDKYKHIEFYKKTYYFDAKSIQNWKYNENDINIKLSSEDMYFKGNKIITLLHALNLKRKCMYDITLNPSIKREKNTFYMFPIFNINIQEKNRQNIITFIGDINNNSYVFSDEFKEYLITNNLFLYVFTRKILNISHSNINIHLNDTQEKFYNILCKSSYIICRPLQEQRDSTFSGLYSIGINYEIPMICHVKIAEKYRFPCITYKESINEVNLDTIKYDNLIQLIKDFKKTELQKNCKIFYTIVECFDKTSCDTNLKCLKK